MKMDELEATLLDQIEKLNDDSLAEDKENAQIMIEKRDEVKTHYKGMSAEEMGTSHKRKSRRQRKKEGVNYV